MELSVTQCLRPECLDRRKEVGDCPELQSFFGRQGEGVGLPKWLRDLTKCLLDLTRWLSD